MSSDSHMTGHTSRTQRGSHFPELWQEELKNQGESYDQRLRTGGRTSHDIRGPLADIDKFDSTPVLLKHGREVSHAQVRLVLIPHEHDIAGLSRV